MVFLLPDIQKVTTGTGYSKLDVYVKR